MSKSLTQDMANQYTRTFGMLEREIRRFSPDQWRKGFSLFQTPAVQAMHLYDCLDFYFCDNPESYMWGHHFKGGWWELPVEAWPDQEGVLDYARQLQARILAHLSSLTYADLSKPAPTEENPDQTYLGELIYALRHTVHHHGQLAALAVWHTGDGGEWE